MNEYVWNSPFLQGFFVFFCMPPIKTPQRFVKLIYSQILTTNDKICFFLHILTDMDHLLSFTDTFLIQIVIFSSFEP